MIKGIEIAWQGHMPFSDCATKEDNRLVYCGIDITDEFENMGIDVYLNISKIFSLPAIVIFNSDEDRNLYRLSGTLKESEHVVFQVVKF